MDMEIEIIRSRELVPQPPAPALDRGTSEAQLVLQATQAETRTCRDQSRGRSAFGNPGSSTSRPINLFFATPITPLLHLGTYGSRCVPKVAHIALPRCVDDRSGVLAEGLSRSASEKRAPC